MASPPKHDAWNPYRPEEQRVVFVRRAGALKPYLGYVIQWPVSGTGGRFLVAYMDEGVSRAVRIEWLDRRSLVPIRIDPNWMTHPPQPRQRAARQTSSGAPPVHAVPTPPTANG